MFATKYLISEVSWELITKYLATISLTDRCWGKIPYRIREVLTSSSSASILYVLEVHNLIDKVEELLEKMYDKVDTKMEKYSMESGKYFKYFFYEDKENTLKCLGYIPIEESMGILSLIERGYLVDE